MAEVRRVRPWVQSALILVAGVGIYRAGAGYLEGKIAHRIEAAANKLGAFVTFDNLRVGVFPPLRITGLTISKPGQWLIRIKNIQAHPRMWGARGLSLIGRVAVEAAQVTLPADLEARFHPTVWDVDPGHSITLISPVQGLTWGYGLSDQGPVVDVKVSKLDVDQLAAFVFEEAPSRQVGVLDGEAHLVGDPRQKFEGRWSFAALGALAKGSVVVAPTAPPTDRGPRVELMVAIEGLDFARLFRTLGLNHEEPSEGLGSLSLVVNAGGLLEDPGNLAVIQQLNFTRPKKRLGAITRLQGEFVHEVSTLEGVARTIDVSPNSTDFVGLQDVPPLFIRTLLIAEDAAFFSHPGLDLTELPRALATNWSRGGAVRGASTITQQLAKNLFLTREKSLQRKLKELSYSFLLESELGKQRILEIYLNIIEWGPDLHGLRPAARHYFDKEPGGLTPKEIAFLVALIPGPLKYQRSIEGGELRPGFETLMNNLLVKLRSVDALSEEEYQAALVQTLALRRPEPPAPIDGTGSEPSNQ